jgi:hypothetical protein
VAGVSNVSDFSLGAVHGCAVAGGRLACWGGRDAVPAALVPESLADLPVASVSAGSLHTCALGGDGALRCWGDDLNLQLGAPADPHSGMAYVGSLPPVASVSAGALHSCARLQDSRIFCWGENNNGRVGDGSVGGRRRDPVEVALGAD